MFIVFGVPILFLNQAKDALSFAKLIYRSDVKEFGHATNKEYIMSESQFAIIEEIVGEQRKKQLFEASPENSEFVDFVSTMDLVS